VPHRVRTIATTALLGSLAAVVWWLGPDPGSVAPALRHPQSYVDTVGADQAALTAVCLLCWAVLGWLAIGLAFAAAAALPGLTGRVCEATADRLLPAALRRTAAVALGVSVATAGGGAALALWHPGDRAPAAVGISVDWPQPAAAHAGSRLNPDWPTHSAKGTQPTKRAHTATQPRTADRAADPVLVRPGDCLWDIVARHLGPGATDAQVAQAWPRWYAANRAVIGPDPNLIYPGQRLTPPEMQ